MPRGSENVVLKQMLTSLKEPKTRSWQDMSLPQNVHVKYIYVHCKFQKTIFF